MKKFFFSSFLICSLQLFSYSLQLNNNSPHYLKAVILGADGTVFAETVMAPNSWNDWSNGDVAFEGPNTDTMNPILPFTVHWYCMDGGDFSVCTMLPNATLVQSLGCNGSCQCKTKETNDKSQVPVPPYGQFSQPPQLPPAPPPQQGSQEQ